MLKNGKVRCAILVTPKKHARLQRLFTIDYSEDCKEIRYLQLHTVTSLNYEIEYEFILIGEENSSILLNLESFDVVLHKLTPPLQERFFRAASSRRWLDPLKNVAKVSLRSRMCELLEETFGKDENERENTVGFQVPKWCKVSFKSDMRKMPFQPNDVVGKVSLGRR